MDHEVGAAFKKMLEKDVGMKFHLSAKVHQPYMGGKTILRQKSEFDTCSSEMGKPH